MVLMCLLALSIRPKDLCLHAILRDTTNGIGILGTNAIHSKDGGSQCEEGGEPHSFGFHHHLSMNQKCRL